MDGLISKLGDQDEAIISYRQAIERDPDDAEVHFALGLILQGEMAGELTFKVIKGMPESGKADGHFVKVNPKLQDKAKI